MLGKETQKGTDTDADALERIVDALNAFIDTLAHQPHDAVGGGQEKCALAGKIAIDGALADLQLLGQKLGVRITVTVFREQLHGRLKDLFFALGPSLGT